MRNEVLVYNFLFLLDINVNIQNHNVRKRTSEHVHPAKIQIRLHSLIKIFTLRILISQGCKISSCRQRKTVREKSRECHNHKPQPFPDTKRKKKPTKLNKHKSNKRTKSNKISSLFPKRGNRNAKRTEKQQHKNKITQGKT